ncbi:MAG: ABC transporter permease subunit, partial [Oscillospiraceae bacterium]|nr:ABC transporter permease subunit [Oscillospiraceae bacterium]
IFALFLNEIQHLGTKKVIQTISYLPHFISWTVCALMMFDFLSIDDGAVNELLLKLHLVNEPIGFFQNGKYFWGLSLVTDIWKELGWNSIIYISAIAGIDIELYEAADIDGATRAQKMWYITLKMIKPTIVLLFILSVGNILNSNFDQIMMLTKNMGNAMLTEYADVIDTFVYRMGLSMGRFSFATAAGLFKAVFNFALLIGANWVTRKAGEEALF